MLFHKKLSAKVKFQNPFAAFRLAPSSLEVKSNTTFPLWWKICWCKNHFRWKGYYCQATLHS